MESVLEKEQIGSGESGRTTAHLANALDDRFLYLEKARGVGAARSRRAWPSAVSWA